MASSSTIEESSQESSQQKAQQPGMGSGRAQLVTQLIEAANLPAFMNSLLTAQAITVVGPGSLLLCSDGLWNYLPEPADLARFCTGNDPTVAARALTEYALQAGGHDNITVAVIPIGGAT